MPTPASAQTAPRNLRIVASPSGSVATIQVLPNAAQLAPGEVVRFTSTITGGAGTVVWNATGGTVGSDGSYTAGVLSGTYLVTATLPGAGSASATVTISGSPVVAIAPGQNIQSIVNSHPAGTTFLLKAGVHRNQTINQVWGGPKSGIDGGNDGGKGITDTPGGLKLQCEGHDVRFRNVWIKELSLEDASTDFEE